MHLISDPSVRAIPIVDGGEALVDLRDVAPGILFDQGWLADDGLAGHNPFLARVGVARRVAAANVALPVGYSLMVEEAFRPIWLQARYWEAHRDHLRREHPAMEEEALLREVSKFVAPPTGSPPHGTGGAVDLVLAFDGRRVDVGWPSDRPGWGAPLSAAVDEPHLARRQMFGDALRGAGFVNYDFEWWHWSYGDQYWALKMGRTQAEYGLVDPDRS